MKFTGGFRTGGVERRGGLDMTIVTRLCGTLFLVLLSAGCSTRLVTGLDELTRGTGQSETDATTSFHAGVHRIVVSYNDETGNEGRIEYSPGNRTVRRGASLFGWSYSEDHGATWKYGGKLSPPPGWAVLWGDPAMTTSRANYGWVYISNLSRFEIPGRWRRGTGVQRRGWSMHPAID
jgi:hypothetical protein